MIQRFYFDTSVIGGVFDSEFEELSTVLFEKVKLAKIKMLYSFITEDELIDAPKKVRAFFNSLSDRNKELIELSEEAIQLAETYLKEGVVGKSSRNDCLHIALPTISKADLLVSWNFKHIVNIYRIRGYNSVNMRMGYPVIEIRSPKEIIEL